MKIEDLEANQIYHTKVWSVIHDTHPNGKMIDALLYVWSKGKRTLKYELIAYTFDPIVYCLRTEKIAKEVKGMTPVSFKKISDLSLYVHYKHKSATFESLLKGDKPVKVKTTSYKL